MKCDVLIVGGGTGGVAAALAARDQGLSVVMTEETSWIGGQLTSQCVPPDEHPWIEQFGCTRRYRELRTRVRLESARRRPLLHPSSEYGSLVTGLNPGGGWVSRLCAEPAVFETCLRQMIASDEALSPPVHVFLRTIPIEAAVDGDVVTAVKVRNLLDGRESWFEPSFVLDATELGDLLPMTATDHVVGAESRQETGEPHAVDGPAQTDNVQAFTWCAAIGWDPDGDHVIDEPRDYRLWKDFVPPSWTGRLLDLTFPNVRTGAPMTLPLFDTSDGEESVTYRPSGPLTLFGYRQIVGNSGHVEPVEAVTVMNWPQNDYMSGSITDADDAARRRHLEGSRQLTLSVLYWLQTELRFKGLRLRPDVTGTEDGLAMAPYVREARRIVALHTVREQDVSSDCHPGLDRAPEVADSVGVGAYRIDLHPAANGAQTIDIGALPFQIPLGCLIPRKTRNLLPACKNIGTTHVTNGCFRLHPVEWNIGESAALLAAFCMEHRTSPQEVHADAPLVGRFQSLLARQGVETAWPRLGPL